MGYRFVAVCSSLFLLVTCGSQEGNTEAARTDATPFKISRRVIYPSEFAPGKFYSPGILVGEKLYLAGQLDRDPKTGEQPGGIEAQTKMAMDNVGRVLKAAGMDFGNVLTCHVQMSDMDDFKDLNKVYGSYYGPDHFPSRTTVEMPGLPDNSGLEVSCVAFGDKSRIQIVAPSDGAIPGAIGPYRPAVWGGDMLYISGNGARNPRTNKVSTDIGGQTQQTLANISSILSAASVDFKNTVYANTYFLDADKFAAIDSVNKSRFAQDDGPARSSFRLSRLPGPTRVEITVIAARDAASIERVGDDPMGALSGNTLWLPAVSGSGANLEAQMRASIEKIVKTLKLADMDLKNIVSVYAYLKEVNLDMASFGDLYREYFPQDPPALSAVQVNQEQLIQLRVVAVQ